MGIPPLGHARLFEHVRKIARCLGLGQFFQPLHQILLVQPHKTPFVRQMPVRKVGVFVLPVEGVVYLDRIRKKSLRNVQDLAAVSSVAVTGEMLVHVLLPPDVVPLGRVGGRRCETPAHVLLA